jgi:hypothetical protein
MAQYDPESVFKIEDAEDGVVITKYLGSEEEVRIPPRIQNKPVIGIGREAFEDCESLTRVTIPDSVTCIEERAFYGCTNLATIIVDSDNAKYSYEHGVLYNKTKTTLVAYPEGKAGSSFDIPDSVTSIGVSAFSSCASLTRVTIGNSVESIEDEAFYGCTNLNNVTIPNSVISISEYAFADCTGLTSVTFQGTIHSNNFGGTFLGNFHSPFDGDLREKYREGGKGTYTRASGTSETWTKQ